MLPTAPLLTPLLLLTQLVHSQISPGVPLDASAANTTTPNDIEPVIVDCTDYHRDTIPISTECIGALQKMPKDAVVRTFHSPGDFPRHFDNGKCVIQIELENAKEDKASWLDIILTAMQLSSGCTRSEYDTGPNLRTGGVLKGIGRANKIVVKIGKPGKMPQSNGVVGDSVGPEGEGQQGGDNVSAAQVS